MANLKLIRELCRSKNITIRELSKRIGRDESSLTSAMRRGSTNTTTLELIAAQLGVSAGVFFEGYEPSDAVEAQREISYLKELLKEKERTIAILMQGKESK